MADIKPYKIHVPDAAISDLHTKLSQATYPEKTAFSEDQGYGSKLTEVRRLAQYWEDGFDWRKAEAKLNELPQYTTDIAVEGFGNINVHFIHQKSLHPNSIPLIFVHGWPGSFFEATKLLPLLTATTDPSFHVVVPSLPNFGFSSLVTKKGFSPVQYAETMHKLMLKLGYDQYVTQGGDWGFFITRMMGLKYPKHVMASNINFLLAEGPPKWEDTPLQFLRYAVTPYTAAEKEGFGRVHWFATLGRGYNLEQSTRPHTIGMALRDSPVALLSWILEKLHDWTDSYPWTDDEILTWISIYQFSTAGPDASVRIYYENRVDDKIVSKTRRWIPTVPLGVSVFPKDLYVMPDVWAHSLGPVVFIKRHESGGHFAAYERPEWLAADLKEMFGPGGGAAHVTKKFS